MAQVARARAIRASCPSDSLTGPHGPSAFVPGGSSVWPDRVLRRVRATVDESRLARDSAESMACTCSVPARLTWRLMS